MFLSCGFSSNKKDNNPIDDMYCRDSSLVLKMAEDTLVSIYGERIKRQRPFKITLSNDSSWMISGTTDTAFIGGVAHIEIRKRDCEIINIIHGK